MNTKLVLSLLAFAGLANAAINAQTIEVTATGVGIGTTTPSTKLAVIGDISSVGSIYAANVATYGVGTNVSRLETTSTSAHLYLVRSLGTWSDTWWEWTHDTGNKLKLGFSSVQQAEFSNGTAAFLGNVGVGTTSPSAKLHVSSAASGLPPMFYANNTLPQWPVVLQTISAANAANSSAAVIGLNLENSSATNGTYSPFITFSRKSDSAAYNPIVAAIGGLYVGQGPDAHWGAGALTFWTSGNSVSGPTERVRVDQSGNVGIGTTSPTHKLTVVGSVRASSFVGDVNSYADFVFKPGYKLASLAEVETSINANGHLPNIPSEAEVKRDGLDVVGMQVKLLQKVEELTLYLVAHDKALQQLRTENEKLLRKISELEKR